MSVSFNPTNIFRMLASFVYHISRASFLRTIFTHGTDFHSQLLCISGTLIHKLYPRKTDKVVNVLVTSLWFYFHNIKKYNLCNSNIHLKYVRTCFFLVSVTSYLTRKIFHVSYSLPIFLFSSATVYPAWKTTQGHSGLPFHRGQAHLCHCCVIFLNRLLPWVPMWLSNLLMLCWNAFHESNLPWCTPHHTQTRNHIFLIFFLL